MKIKLDPRNARKHDDRNKDAISKSLRDLGAGRSVVADADGMLIGGNGVYEQAEKAGVPIEVVHTTGDKLVVVVRDDLPTDSEKRKALAIADNRLTDLSEFDQSSLNELIAELSAEGGDLDFESLGYSYEEVEEMMTAAADIEEISLDDVNTSWRIHISCDNADELAILHAMLGTKSETISYAVFTRAWRSRDVEGDA